ncbi:MAG: DUF4157 domain-containing protein [Candidatus Bathyarchaeota archaeon]|nr:DUF4157 domain-containing protein [Candidatus Termiticorpusculum sp.]
MYDTKKKKTPSNVVQWSSESGRRHHDGAVDVVQLPVPQPNVSVSGDESSFERRRGFSLVNVPVYPVEYKKLEKTESRDSNRASEVWQRQPPTETTPLIQSQTTQLKNGIDLTSLPTPINIPHRPLNTHDGNNNTANDVLQRQPTPNSTPASGGTTLPTHLQEKYEHQSGLSLTDVRVHYNSEEPAKLGAYAYAQGNQIHIAPRQEQHLPHEIGHIIQQKAGIVRPTIQLNGVYINDNPTLEHEAEPLTLPAKTDVPYNSQSVLQLGRSASVPDPVEMTTGTYTKKFEPIAIYIVNTPANNMLKHSSKSADLHVAPSNGFSFFKQIIPALDYLQNNMIADGDICMKPTGAAIVKIMVELLGESICKEQELQIARDLQTKRKNLEKSFVASRVLPTNHGDVISPGVVPEHIAYLQAIRQHVAEHQEASSLTISAPGSLGIWNPQTSSYADMLRDEPAFQHYCNNVNGACVSLSINMKVFFIERFKAAIQNYVTRKEQEKNGGR